MGNPRPRLSTELTQGGLPAEAAFQFTKRLDDPSYVWVQWRSGVYQSFTLPAINETINLPSITLSI